MDIKGAEKAYLAEVIHFAEVDVLMLLVVVLLAPNDGDHMTSHILEADRGSEIATDVLDLIEREAFKQTYNDDVTNNHSLAASRTGTCSPCSMHRRHDTSASSRGISPQRLPPPCISHISTATGYSSVYFRLERGVLCTYRLPPMVRNSTDTLDDA